MNRLLICLLATTLFTVSSHAAADLKKIAADIDGYRYEFPCKDPMPENPKPGADGISARMTDDPKTNNKFTDVKKFGGEVTIYHDPHHPALSVVRREISLQVLWVPFAAIVALAWAIWHSG